MTEERYHHNLELWSTINPRAAIWLQYLECENLKLFKEENGLFNLRRKDGEKIYPTGNPVVEATKWAKGLDLKDVEVLYVYGVGLGYYYQALKKWLESDEERHVVFLEDDLEVIACFFETELGTKILTDPQASVYFFSEIRETEMIFNELYWHSPMAKIGFGVLEDYQKRKESRYDELHHQISYDSGLKNSLLQEYLECGVAFFKNYYSNIVHLNQGYLGDSLFGHFDQVPAIICGAGPSFQKNRELLKKIGNKAIIFGGSSSLNALDKGGIKPHLGAGIDPNPMQEERLRQIKHLDYPFLYRNRVYPQALQVVKGPKLMVTGCGGYDIASYFEAQFGIQGEEIEEGRNVVNFCLEVAHKMGCNPIIFVGLDLAYTDMKEYTSGVVEDPSVTKEALLTDHTFNETAILKADIYGNPVYTLWKWVSEAKWIGDFATLHPEITLINATEGGLGFPSVPNQTLQKVIDEYLAKDHDVEKRIKKCYFSCSLSKITDKKIERVVSRLEKSLKKVIRDFRVLNEENEKIIAKLKKNKSVEQIQTGKAALVETELLGEPAFIYVLSIFNDVISRMMQKDIRKLSSHTNQLSEDQKELKKLELNTKKYTFLSDVAKINLNLLANGTRGVYSEGSSY